MFNQTEYYYDYLPSPLGNLLLCYTSQHIITALKFDSTPETLRSILQKKTHSQLADLHLHTEDTPVKQSIRAYFAGNIYALETIHVLLYGTTFEKYVWEILRKIPPATTVSYKTIAEWIEKPKAYRAVGKTNGANLIPLILPCHRVIGSQGNLVGYAGGLERKKWLLEHEKKHIQISN